MKWNRVFLGLCVASIFFFSLNLLSLIKNCENNPDCIEIYGYEVPWNLPGTTTAPSSDSNSSAHILKDGRLSVLNSSDDQLIWKYATRPSPISGSIGEHPNTPSDSTDPPVDVVYTWVNGSDPRFLKSMLWYQKHQANIYGERHDKPNRFRDKEEIRYSIRSLVKFAPWVRNIYIVTCGQVPYWLRIDHPRLKVIPHSVIFPKRHLPNFNSFAIESHLKDIPGISDQFIYFMDDVMLGRPVTLQDFYTQKKGTKIYLEAHIIPSCHKGCTFKKLQNGRCDKECNVEACNWDNGDCGKDVDEGKEYKKWENGLSPDRAHDSIFCNFGCPTEWVGDQVCDDACNNADCGYDAGDCGVEIVRKGLYGPDLSTKKKAANKGKAESIHIPPDITALYLDLSHTFRRLYSAQYESPTATSNTSRGLIRSSIVLPHTNLLVVLLHRSDDSPLEIPFDPRGHLQVTGTLRNITAGPQDRGRNQTISILLDQTPTTEEPFVQPGSGHRHLLEETHGQATTNSKSLLAVQYVDARVNDVDYNHGDNNGDVGPSLNLSRANQDLQDAIYKNKTEQLRALISETIANYLRSRPVESESNQISLDDLVQTRIDTNSLPLSMEPSTIDAELLMQLGVHKEDIGSMLATLQDQSSPISRRMHSYVEALRFVETLYSNHYAQIYQQPYAIAHVPYMLDRRVLNDLHHTFPLEFEATSSHRFRHKHDMQFQLAYYYYLMFEAKRKKRVPKYKYEIIRKSKDVRFFFVDKTNRKSHYVKLRRDRYKFICINDNIVEGTVQDHMEQFRLLREFYEDYFPEPCVFERPKDDPHQSLHLNTILHKESMKQ